MIERDIIGICVLILYIKSLYIIFNYFVFDVKYFNVFIMIYYYVKEIKESL